VYNIVQAFDRTGVRPARVSSCPTDTSPADEETVMTATVTTRPAPVHRITSARSPRPPVRLTRRGRLVVLLVLVALAFTLASVGRAAGWASAADPAGGRGGTVATEWVVQPGETLWQVAVAVAPDTDPRETVARIVELNDLPDASVRAGQTLLVPTTPR
jgi:LysM domain